MLGIIDANCLRGKEFLTPLQSSYFFLACFKNTLKTRMFSASIPCFFLFQFTEFLLFRAVQLSLVSFSALRLWCVSVALIVFRS